MRTPSTRYVAIAGAVLLATVTTFSLWPASREVRTDDRNGDGRPDVWRTYDRQGNVVEQDIDSNFDGRSDIHENYQRGQLVHRESDRNFDDRIDLVEEFDATTHEHVRSVVDHDFDGTADLLVLFQGGRPVFSKWAPGGGPGEEGYRSVDHTIASRHGNALIASFVDPFSNDLALRSIPITPDTPANLWTAVGLPVVSAPALTDIRSGSDLHTFYNPPPVSSVVRFRSPRGPPLA